MSGLDEDRVAGQQRRWLEAERTGDVVTLDSLAVPDFTLVTPDGDVRTREQWLARFAAGLRITSLEWEQGPLTVLGDLAIVVGRQTLRGHRGDQPVDERCRASHVYVRVSESWRLVGIQLTS